MSEIDTSDLIGIPEIASIFSLTPKYVSERVVTRPDFPPPKIRLSRQCRKWSRREVLAAASPDEQRSRQG